MAIQVYKFHADPTGKSYVTNVGGVWRGIDDPNLIPEELKANAPTTSDETYRGTSGGAMSYGDLVAHQAGIDEQARIRALPQTTFDPAKAQTSTFRPRGAGEDMTSYLQAKQAQEMQTTGKSAISFGTQPATQQPNQPALNTNPTSYYKVNTGNLGADGRPAYDIYDALTNQKISAEQGTPLFAGGLNVEFIPEKPVPGQQPSQPTQPSQPAQGAETIQQPTSAGKPATEPPIESSEVSATQPYVRYLGSPDIFETSTGKYVTEAEGKANPSIFSKVQDIPTPRPGVQTEEDFKNLERTNLQLQQSGATTTPQDFQNNPLKAFQDTYSQIWNNLGLGSVKEQIETTLKAMKEVDFEMIDKIAEVNDNPWISEAERSRQVIKMQGKYEQKNKANTENLKLLQGLFETGQKEAQFVSSNALDVYYKERTFDENEKLKAMDLAEKMTTAMNKKSFQDLVGSDGRMHTYIVNEAGERLADLGVSELPKAETDTYKPPTSYQEWDLAGRPGSYADWLKKGVDTGLTDVELARVDKTKEAENLKLLADLKASAERYKDTLSEYGYEAYGTGKTLLDNTYAELQVKWKEAARLGALTGPDLQLILDAVKPATGIRGAISTVTGGGVTGITAGVDQMLARLDSDGTREFKLLNARNVKYPNDPYIQALGDPFDSGEKENIIIEGSTKSGMKYKVIE